MAACNKINNPQPHAACMPREALEEIRSRGKQTFQQAGGGELVLIPCLNEHSLWMSALENRFTGSLFDSQTPKPPLEHFK